MVLENVLCEYVSVLFVNANNVVVRSWPIVRRSGGGWWGISTISWHDAVHLLVGLFIIYFPFWTIPAGQAVQVVGWLTKNLSHVHRSDGRRNGRKHNRKHCSLDGSFHFGDSIVNHKLAPNGCILETEPFLTCSYHFWLPVVFIELVNWNCLWHIAVVGNHRAQYGIVGGAHSMIMIIQVDHICLNTFWDVIEFAGV